MNWKRWILAVLIMTVVATTLAGTVLAPPRDPTITLTLEWIREWTVKTSLQVPTFQTESE